MSFREKDFQKEFVAKLVANGYEELKNRDYDRLHALCPSALIRFLDKTQPKTMEALRKLQRNGSVEDLIISHINSAETSKNGSRLDILKHGVDIGPYKLILMYDKPASNFNANDVKLYQENIFTVIPEVEASNDERIDVVIFLNGLAIMAFELKNGVTQLVGDAITQFKKERHPETRLFQWKAGVLVSFAMDPFEVNMTTRLAKDSTYFLPFNQGAGEGVNAGKGNPVCENDYVVHYMWDNILTKDSVLEIISKFMFIERKEEKDKDTGVKTKKETVIFPRYHQLDVVRKLLESTKESHTDFNYLIQHSAGSGKTNEIAWLSYRLSELYDNDVKIVFDKVVVCTDRIIVDKQLQEAISMLEHSDGKIKVLDDSCDSGDLEKALEKNTKIVVTTIQKFRFILDTVKTLNDKKFAVIIDEAHSSTAGKSMDAVTTALGDSTVHEGSAEEQIEKELENTGKPQNVSIFAFTATPKDKTLRLFGTPTVEGNYQAFHVYSMKQAIEEGFILDVLQNYTTYDTYYELNKNVDEDPELNTAEAKRQIARYVNLHETNISQRVEIIIEHFRNVVMGKILNGAEKAMVVTDSRESAVRYKQAFENYIKEHNYNNIHALVAFTGKLTVDSVEYSERGINGFPDSQTRDQFDTDLYQVLIVADKYQTGFDQKKLCAMYILKKLSGVAVVQTLSRLNRICPPFDKHTFILDFVNKYEDVIKDFAPYYTYTALSGNPLGDCKNLYDRVLGYSVFYEADVDDFVDCLYAENANKTKKLIGLLQKAAKAIRDKAKENKDRPKEIRMSIRSYIRCYEFLRLVTNLNSAKYYKMYLFLNNLKGMLETDAPGLGFDIKDKLKAEGFIQKKRETIVTPVINADPEVSLTNAAKVNFTEEKKERLSEIIKDINNKTGLRFNEETAYAAILQVKENLKKNENLQRSAKTNTLRDFESPYYNETDGALTEGYEQNVEFYKLLLKNEDIKREFMNLFMSDVYESCKTPTETNPLR